MVLSSQVDQKLRNGRLVNWDRDWIGLTVWGVRQAKSVSVGSIVCLWVLAAGNLFLLMIVFLGTSELIMFFFAFLLNRFAFLLTFNFLIDFTELGKEEIFLLAKQIVLLRKTIFHLWIYKIWNWNCSVFSWLVFACLLLNLNHLV